MTAPVADGSEKAPVVKVRKPRKDKGMKRSPKKQKTDGGTCLFSGKSTKSPKAMFLPGHDAKLKSVLLKVMKDEAKMSDIPAAARAVLKERALVGFRITEAGVIRKVS
jgi:hypothetical protein